MSGAITRSTPKRGEALVRDVAVQIARRRPELADLTRDQLAALARVVVAESLKDDLRQRADLAAVDYQAERNRFLATARSPHTRKAYRAGLDLLEAEAARLGVSPLELSPAQCDDWIAAMQGAPSTIRLRVAAASAFYTWIERRHAAIRNPLRGSKARPKIRANRTLAVPSEAEITAIMQAAKPVLRAAVAVMAGLGLRVGALPELVIRGGRYVTTSKGRDISGELGEIIREIEQAGLPLRSPFGTETAATIADRFRDLTRRLHAAGVISARYSVHDLRHAFAVRLYSETRDVFAVSRALGHAGVAVTESYLRSIGLR